MKNAESPFKLARRRVLKLLGLGAVGAGVFSVASPHRLFAEHFLKEAPRSENLDTDISPLSLAIRPHAVERVGASYDWTRQQARGAEGLQLATETAICDTGPTPTNIAGQQDQVPDCRFD